MATEDDSSFFMALSLEEFVIIALLNDGAELGLGDEVGDFDVNIFDFFALVFIDLLGIGVIHMLIVRGCSVQQRSSLQFTFTVQCFFPQRIFSHINLSGGFLWRRLVLYLLVNYVLVGALLLVLVGMRGGPCY